MKQITIYEKTANKMKDLIDFDKRNQANYYTVSRPTFNALVSLNLLNLKEEINGDYVYFPEMSNFKGFCVRCQESGWIESGFYEFKGGNFKEILAQIAQEDIEKTLNKLKQEYPDGYCYYLQKKKRQDIVFFLNMLLLFKASSVKKEVCSYAIPHSNKHYELADGITFKDIESFEYKYIISHSKKPYYIDLVNNILLDNNNVVVECDLDMSSYRLLYALKKERLINDYSTQDFIIRNYVTYKW